MVGITRRSAWGSTISEVIWKFFKPDRFGRFHLTRRDGLQPAAHILCRVRRAEDYRAHQGADHPVDARFGGQEERQDDREHE